VYAATYAKRRRDVRFYAQLVRGLEGPILELGAGNGRVSLALAREKRRIFALDQARPMLRDLEQRALALGLEDWIVPVRADMRAFELRKKFELVIAPFNALLHLYTAPDFLRCFSCVRRHLKPGGRFVFDYSVPRLEDLARANGTFSPATRVKIPLRLNSRSPTANSLLYSERSEYGEVHQVLLTTLRYRAPSGVAGQKSVVDVPLAHRQVFPQEICALLRQSGFGSLELCEDFTARPASDAVDSLVVTCRRK
jgi:SAM-dependent methyltransferase